VLDAEFADGRRVVAEVRRAGQRPQRLGLEARGRTDRGFDERDEAGQRAEDGRRDGARRGRR
jgi:hypothetical protein